MCLQFGIHSEVQHTDTTLSTVLLKATGYKTLTSSRRCAVHLSWERRQPPVSTSVENVTRRSCSVCKSSEHQTCGITLNATDWICRATSGVVGGGKAFVKNDKVTKQTDEVNVLSNVAPARKCPYKRTAQHWFFLCLQWHRATVSHNTRPLLAPTSSTSPNLRCLTRKDTVVLWQVCPHLPFDLALLFRPGARVAFLPRLSHAVQWIPKQPRAGAGSAQTNKALKAGGRKIVWRGDKGERKGGPILGVVLHSSSDGV